MLETIVFVGAALCVQLDAETTVCQNANQQNERVIFHKAVTDWQKITSKTIYNSEEEVKIDQKNTCP